MNWIELSTHATHEAIDWIRTLLATAHYQPDIQIKSYSKLSKNSDKTPANSAQWAFTIYLYLPDDYNSHTEIEKIIQLLSSLHRTGMIDQINVATVEEKTTNQTQQSSFRVGRFVIKDASAIDQMRSPDDIPLILENSLAFGSGLHPATILSLKLIERYVTPGMHTLDLGCGSGILSVAMAKLGAQVLAIDNDAIAIEATQVAINLNKVTEQVTTTIGSLGSGSSLGHWMGGNLNNEVATIQTDANFNLIAANILARIHITLVDDYRKALKKTNTYAGLLITSGYTNDYAEEIDTTFARSGFEQVACDRLNEWTAFVHQLKT